MTVAVGRASGKLILCGEHAVVHGQPAIAFAVSLTTTVTLTPWDGPVVNDTAIDDPMVDAALRHELGEVGWRVAMSTELPIGRGMGSSAALAVALVRAHAHATGRALTTLEAFDAAQALERIFHATPSGLDVAVAVYGGALRYQRPAPGSDAPPTFTPLPCPTWQVVVLDTGKAGSTKALVAGVTSRRPGIDPLLDRIGQIVDAAQAHLDDPAALGPLLDENHDLLNRIGVGTPELDALCDLARRHGAHGAKLSGAGGGGVAIALVDDPAPVLAAAAAAGVRAWACRPHPAPQARP